MQKREKGRSGQITVFVITALIIVVVISLFFAFKDSIFPVSVPAEISPVYSYYVSCVNGLLEDGIKIAESKAGYIENPEFEQGTRYAPFGSELNFLGQGVPYWYTISGNGLVKENIPTKIQIEQQLNNYLQQEISKCVLDSFVAQGYNISLGESKFKTSIQSTQINSKVSQKIAISYADKNFVINGFDLKVSSSFSSLYDLAKQIYSYEKSSMFLENYSLDVLNTYAPVSGIEINCSPVVWQPHEVFTNLRKGLETNLQLLRFSGDYYTNVNPYFVVKNSNIKLNGKQVNFAYSSDWASRFEVWPTQNNLMVANPIGSQVGLNAMGFCYAPYKFVYDMYFPVMIQIYNSDLMEFFQFPVAVVINKNVARESLSSESIEPAQSVCNNANVNLSINTYDINLNPVESSISFRCLTDSCSLGSTKINSITNLSSLTILAPQCVNGVLVAQANGYKQVKYVISTNEEDSADIILEREYNLPLEIYVDGKSVEESSVLIISQNVGGKEQVVDSISYPFTKKIKLSEGEYSFDLKVFGSGSLTIPATTTKQCVSIPQDNILGALGFDQEQCTEITTPSQTLSNIPHAGGKQTIYISESELAGANKFRILSSSIKTPTSIQEVQDSYALIEEKALDIQTA